MNRRDFLKTTIGGLLAGIGLKFGIDKLKLVDTQKVSPMGWHTVSDNSIFLDVKETSIGTDDLEFPGCPFTVECWWKPKDQRKIIFEIDRMDKGKWHHLVFENGELVYMDGEKV